MSPENIHQIAQQRANALRVDPDIVGVWHPPYEPSELGTEVIVSQKGDQSAELIIIKEGSKPKVISGKIISRRKESGYPVRQMVFVAPSGQEVVLERKEF